MQSRTLLIDSKSSAETSGNFSITYTPPTELDTKLSYEIGLISAEIWMSIFNVKKDINDDITYYSGARGSVKKIPPGAYNVKDINKTLKRLTTDQGVNSDNTLLEPNYNTLRAAITLKNNVFADFITDTSVGSLLSFNKKQYDSTVIPVIKNEGEKLVDITEVNSILINCSIANGSYPAVVGRGQTIYSFSPNFPPGLLMQITPRSMIYTYNYTY